MGTRSRIGVMHGDIVKSVYCHWDGYLEHNGRILLEHYDSAKANHLVALGDVSSLAPEIGEQHPFSQFHLPEDQRVNYDKWTTFYGRDRGEPDTGWRVAHTFEEFLDQCEDSGAEYYYIMRDGTWYVGDSYDRTEISGRLVPLAQALAEQALA